jgi:hypothetical protein
LDFLSGFRFTLKPWICSSTWCTGDLPGLLPRLELLLRPLLAFSKNHSTGETCKPKEWIHYTVKTRKGKRKYFEGKVKTKHSLP